MHWLPDSGSAAHRDRYFLDGKFRRVAGFVRKIPARSERSSAAQQRQEERCGADCDRCAGTIGRRGKYIAARTAHMFAPFCNARHSSGHCPPHYMAVTALCAFRSVTLYTAPLTDGSGVPPLPPLPSPARRCNRTSGARFASVVGFPGLPCCSCSLQRRRFEVRRDCCLA